MFLLGHIGFALFANFTLERISEYPIRHKKVVLAIASMLPDIIDKSIGVLLFQQGRWIGHSFVIQSLTFVLCLAILQLWDPGIDRVQEYIVLIYSGMIIHLLLDAPSIEMITVFWPLLGPFPQGNGLGFLLGFQSTTIITTELIGFFLLLFIGKIERQNKRYWYTLSGLTVTYLGIFIMAYTIFVGW